MTSSPSSPWAKAPFPYFGGKRDAAALAWRAMGDVEHYVEPFFGSGAVLLARPHAARTYASETVNDMDGLLVNVWRSIQSRPDDVARAASWPVSEADLHARHLALVEWRASGELERMLADPARCDPEMAGWWVWGASCWIGSGWCSGRGPWARGDDGALAKVTAGGGIHRQLPAISDDGKGVAAPIIAAPIMREGVNRKLPHLSHEGCSVVLKRPALGNAGRGVVHPPRADELPRLELDPEFSDHVRCSSALGRHRSSRASKPGVPSVVSAAAARARHRRRGERTRREAVRPGMDSPNRA